jgi:hypothetical protein
MESEHQVPIWFFIGGTLAVYGLLILGVGLHNLAFPPEHPVELADWHADLWWGGLMTVIGAVYCLRFHPWRREE